MYKFSFCIAVLFLFSTTFAQKVSFSIYSGYGFSAPSEVLGIQVETEKTTNIYGTLGAGFNFGIRSTYQLKPNFEMELGFSYFNGATTLTSRVKNDFGVFTRNEQAQQFRLNPSLILRHEGEKLGFYFKPGLVLPLTNTSFIEEKETGSGTMVASGQTLVTKYESKYFFAVGYSAVIGGTVKLSNKLAFFSELSGLSLRTSTKIKTLTSYIINEQEQIDNIKEVDKITNYDDQMDTVPNPDPNTSKTLLSLKQSFGAIFLNIGLKFSF